MAVRFEIYGDTFAEVALTLREIADTFAPLPEAETPEQPDPAPEKAAAPKKAAAKKAEKKPDPEPEKAEEKPDAPDAPEGGAQEAWDTAQGILAKLYQSGQKDEVLELFKTFGATRFGEIPVEKGPEVLAAAKALQSGAS